MKKNLYFKIFYILIFLWMLNINNIAFTSNQINIKNKLKKDTPNKLNKTRDSSNTKRTNKPIVTNNNSTINSNKLNKNNVNNNDFEINKTGQVYFIMPIAVGAGLSWSIISPYGEQKFHRLNYELMSYLYLHLLNHLYLRPGIRLIYSDDQPDMSKKLQIIEKDFYAFAEVAIVREWYIIITIAAGYGINYHTVKLKYGYPITQAEDKISHSETKTVYHYQLGLGIPILKGVVVIEPFFRNLVVVSKNLATYGVELSLKF